MRYTNRRILYVYDIGVDLQPLNPENLLLFNEGSYNGLQAYKNSKAANIMFAYELARKLSGSGVKVNAVCPGKLTMPTGICNLDP